MSLILCRVSSRMWMQTRGFSLSLVVPTYASRTPRMRTRHAMVISENSLTQRKALCHLVRRDWAHAHGNGYVERSLRGKLAEQSPVHPAKLTCINTTTPHIYSSDFLKHLAELRPARQINIVQTRDSLELHRQTPAATSLAIGIGPSMDSRKPLAKMDVELALQHEVSGPLVQTQHVTCSPVL